MNDRLEYYQKHTKEAFKEGFTCRTQYEVIDSECYQVHKYYLPIHAAKKVRWVKRYFEALDDASIDIMYKRRKHFVEYAETSLLMLSRVNFIMMKNKRSIVAGSAHIGRPIAWCIFGDAERNRISQIKFVDIVEIANYYSNYLHGNCYPVDIHFRIGSTWAEKIAFRFEKTPLNSPNFWMTVAILLTYDIIHNCGPDCSEFFELFTNDYRESTDNFNLTIWEQLRCKILGVSPKFDVNKIPFRKTKRVVLREWIGPLESPKKPYRAKTEVALISDSQDLAAGEKTIPTKPIDIHDRIPVGRLPIPHHWPEDTGMYGSHGIGSRFRAGLDLGWDGHLV